MKAASILKTIAATILGALFLVLLLGVALGDNGIVKLISIALIGFIIFWNTRYHLIDRKNLDTIKKTSTVAFISGAALLILNIIFPESVNNVFALVFGCGSMAYSGYLYGKYTR